MGTVYLETDNFLRFNRSYLHRVSRSVDRVLHRSRQRVSRQNLRLVISLPKNDPFKEWLDLGIMKGLESGLLLHETGRYAMQVAWCKLLNKVRLGRTCGLSSACPSTILGRSGWTWGS